MKKQREFQIIPALNLILFYSSVIIMAHDTDCDSRTAMVKSCSIDDPVGMMGTEPTESVEVSVSPPDSGVIILGWNSATMHNPENR